MSGYLLIFITGTMFEARSHLFTMNYFYSLPLITILQYSDPDEPVGITLTPTKIPVIIIIARIYCLWPKAPTTIFTKPYQHFATFVIKYLYNTNYY